MRVIILGLTLAVLDTSLVNLALPDIGAALHAQARTARSPQRGLRYLATRFSAKEAFSKAIGLGMRMPMTWRACEILNLPTGQPTIVLHDPLKAWFEARGLHAHVTVTDEGDHAASFVVVEQNRPSANPDTRPPV